MNAPAKPRCTLARFVPTEMDIEEVKKNGWNEHQILVVNLDDPRVGPIERQVINHLGNRLYGDKRNGR